MSTSKLSQGLIHLCIYAPGTFFSNPAKPFLNAYYGSSYAIAYAHFRRDHSLPANILGHIGCLFLQVISNFAFLECLDSQLGLAAGLTITSFTAIVWTAFLMWTPSPLSVRASTIVLLLGAYLVRKWFTNVIGFVQLAFFTGPGELMCYCLYMPDHGIPRPGWLGFLALLLGRSALWFVLSSNTGCLGAILGYRASNLVVVGSLALGSLIRSKNNLPLVSQFGGLGWVLAILFGQPWVYFLSLSFLGAGLQGVAHELTRQLGTLNQLKNASYELAHTSYFPLLTLQTLHHSWFGPYASTVKGLGKQGDARSRKALGLKSS